MTALTIGIASIGRPSLMATLASLAAIERPAGLSMTVLVADDSPDGAVARLIAGAGPWPFGLAVLPVAAGNISVARNACLAAAATPLMAFVDDDERVSTDWLVRLIAAMAEFEADVVIGPVFPVYPPGTPDWLRRADPLHVDWGRRGRRVDTGRTGNVLFRRDDPRWSGLRFDPAFGRTGGEDTDYFHRLHRAGAAIVVTDDARIDEEVPAARLQPAYLRRRTLRSGQSYAAFRLGGRRGFGPAGLIFHAGNAAKALAGLAAALLLRPVDRARSLRFALKFWLNLGKLRQLTGRDLPSLY
ncbi:glycosyltransferase family 2 protein [Prosthecodimorpha staleyi]|uniref:Glycosyltransferase n=1 Tax=Prosthecodimorpha staleyi TaxID=2840188 RepID=A0A947GD76_9HYPH|nr:glycosyltransferase [Prosthecodimorpha staleyi]MBT9292233.1 glycosyltransferase [Prosthecodimorpha staleyi]